MPKSINFGKRRSTFRRAIELMEERKAKTLVETGVARAGLKFAKSDGASTIVFGHWAKKNDAVLHSVDISQENIDIAQKEVNSQNIQGHVNLHVSDSIAYLQGFEGTIDFLYLDSYDYHKHDKKIQHDSQMHHLKEFQAIEDRLCANTIVLIDDCKLPGGGKGKMVIEYMLGKGWKIELKRYQTLLVRNMSNG